jgi:hypothetical protein
MIRPEDLRIGNWLQDQSGYFKVRAIELGVTFLDEPIPLTEEILVKAGFKKYIVVGKTIFYLEMHGKIVLGYWLIDGAVNVGEFILAKVEFLHDLQNLVYALTKQELTIDL